MASDYAKSELERMYKELTDDDIGAEVRRKAENKAFMNDKISDTGL